MLLGLAAVGLIVGLLGLPASASAAPSSVPVPVTCTTATGASAQCTAEIVRFTGSGDSLGAVTQVTNLATGESENVTLPVTTLQQGQTCTILDLTIGPIDLFLLGIRIQTNEIRLTITAQRGTLLGDLLCGLFFGPNTTTTQQAGLLTSLVRQGGVSPAAA